MNDTGQTHQRQHGVHPLDSAAGAAAATQHGQAADEFAGVHDAVVVAVKDGKQAVQQAVDFRASQFRLHGVSAQKVFEDALEAGAADDAARELGAEGAVQAPDLVHSELEQLRHDSRREGSSSCGRTEVCTPHPIPRHTPTHTHAHPHTHTHTYSQTCTTTEDVDEKNGGRQKRNEASEKHRHTR